MSGLFQESAYLGCRDETLHRMEGPTDVGWLVKFNEFQ